MACDKRCMTKQEADTFIKNKSGKKQYRREIRAYYCEEHNAWHTSSKDNDVSIEATVIHGSKWSDLLK